MVKLKKFPVIDKLVMDLLKQFYPDTPMGGDLSYDGKYPYVWISGVNGAGRNSQIEGMFYVDIDVFDTNFLRAKRMAYDIEANLLAGHHRVGSTVIDRVRQSSPPEEIPWRDDSHYRINATYSFILRRV